MPQPAREVDHRKPPMESRWTRNRRRLEGTQTAAPPPPQPDYVVTGDGNPSPNGDYYEAGTYNGKPWYQRDDQAFLIWWNDIGLDWNIDTILGDRQNYWYGPYDEILGTYTPQGTYTGNPELQLP